MPTDAELLDKWADGDASAARELIDRYFEGLARFFRSKVPGDVDDLIQQTFMICVRRRTELRDRSSFRAYLYSVARNEAHGFFRKRQRRGEFDPLQSSVVDFDPSPSQVLARKQERRLLVEGLRHLPLDLQIALELRYWEQLTGPELAEVLEIPEGTVRSRLRRATEALRVQLEHMEATGGPALRDSATDLDGWAARIRDQLHDT